MISQKSLDNNKLEGKEMKYIKGLILLGLICISTNVMASRFSIGVRLDTTGYVKGPTKEVPYFLDYGSVRGHLTANSKGDIGFFTKNFLSKPGYGKMLTDLTIWVPVASTEDEHKVKFTTRYGRSPSRPLIADSKTETNFRDHLYYWEYEDGPHNLNVVIRMDKPEVLHVDLRKTIENKGDITIKAVDPKESPKSWMHFEDEFYRLTHGEGVLFGLNGAGGVRLQVSPFNSKIVKPVKFDIWLNGDSLLKNMVVYKDNQLISIPACLFSTGPGSNVVFDTNSNIESGISFYDVWTTADKPQPASIDFTKKPFAYEGSISCNGYATDTTKDYGVSFKDHPLAMGFFGKENVCKINVFSSYNGQITYKICRKPEGDSNTKTSDITGGWSEIAIESGSLSSGLNEITLMESTITVQIRSVSIGGADSELPAAIEEEGDSL